MQFLDNATIEKVIDIRELVEHLRQAHQGDKVAAEDILMLEPITPPSGATFLTRAAWMKGEMLGLKTGAIMPSNAAKGLPVVQTLVLLIDGKDGHPVCVMDGLPITNWKTAADSALGSKLLARKDVETHLMVGAGTLAPYLIRAHAAVHPTLKRFLVWNRGGARAEALQAALKGQGIVVDIVDNLAAAIKQADVISTATFAEEPLVKGLWLKDGTHLDLVGSYLPSMQEADVEAMKRGRVFVDSREGTVGRCGELNRAIEAGAMTLADILGDLYDLSAERVPARLSDKEITVFKNAGGGHLDMMTAQFVAKRLGLMA